MGQQYSALNHRLQSFISNQKLFFEGTAACDGRVNVSPKGLDTLRVLDEKRVAWLDLTGSSNETAAHLTENDRMTLMFCAFERPPMILRLYGHARAIHPYNGHWSELIGHFPPLSGARQVIEMQIELVQTSCGMGVPLYDVVEDRRQLVQWAKNRAMTASGRIGSKKIRSVSTEIRTGLWTPTR